MPCKNCGGSDLEQQGCIIIEENQDQSWAQEYLKNQIYTCLQCGFTIGFKKD